MSSLAFTHCRSSAALRALTVVSSSLPHFRKLESHSSFIRFASSPKLVRSVYISERFGQETKHPSFVIVWWTSPVRPSGPGLLPTGFFCFLAIAAWAFSRRSKWRLLSACGTAASLVAEHRLQVCRLQQLQLLDSVVVAHQLSCSSACGTFLDQGSNQCPLHCKVDSQPLDHQRNLYWGF